MYLCNRKGNQKKSKDMSTKDLNTWFNNLDSYDLSLLFPGEFEDAMMSADPDENINTFIDEAKAHWKCMDKEEKIRLYNFLEG